MRITSLESLVHTISSEGQTGPIRVGVDIAEIDRIRAVVERWGERFLRRIYTEGERAYCRKRPPQLAARFAAKEAVMKALGTGTRGVGWKDIEVCREKSGAPTVRLHGRAMKRAQTIGLAHFAISLSHSREHAIAFVIATRGESV